MTTTSMRNGFPADARSAAALYIGLRLAPVPLAPRSKRPIDDGYLSLRLTADTLDEYFPAGEGRNIGILNGTPSANVIDVDVDSAEARIAATLLLPKTGMIFGRESFPRSHWLYRVDLSLKTAQQGFTDVTGAMLVELRGDGGQTCYPPSIHEGTGEPITWCSFTEPGEVSLLDLQRAVARLAAAALFARHWPAKGSRDAAAMALTGGLTRAGWDDEQVSVFVEAMAVAAGDEEARSRAGKANRTAQKQEQGQKTTGWPKLEELLGDHGEKVVRKVRDWLRISVPAQLVADVPMATPWPDPPGEEAFYGLAGRFVSVIEPSTEADRAGLLFQKLIAFGNAAGRSAHFRVEATRHYSNEFGVLVGKTSKARKGTSWGHTAHAMEKADQHWLEEKVASGVSSGEGIIHHVRDPINSREKVSQGRGEAPRYEDVEKDPGIEDKRLMIFEPEFANVLKQTERQGNTASVVLRNAWDGQKVLRTLTKNSPTRATDAHVSLVGHITVEELQRYLTVTETANGFGNRFMFVCVDRSKKLPEGGYFDHAAFDALCGELCQALAFAKAAGELTRDDEARVIWRSCYDDLSEGRPGLAGALLARSEAHVMRLAMLYALLDQSAIIKAPHLLAALAIWEYCERSVRFIFGDSLGDDVADELLRFLRGALPSGLTRTDISNHFQRNASSNRIGRALGLLMQHHLIRRQDEETGGRRAERWFAVRK